MSALRHSLVHVPPPEPGDFNVDGEKENVRVDEERTKKKKLKNTNRHLTATKKKRNVLRCNNVIRTRIQSDRKKK